ncbi:MAG: hypothetical protein ABIJ52_12295 [Pseudomonadota bacterium]
MDTKHGEQLAALVIKEIQDAYLKGKIVKTIGCVDNMLREGLYEADVEKVIMGATSIEKAMPATSPKASNPKNTHYVIYGESTKCLNTYCKLCSNYHPITGEFLEWRLTSFCIK